MRATLKDVAEAAKVSFTLVSKYLNHNPNARMTPETRERIDRAIETLHYSPSAAARTLRSGRSHTVGMICGTLTNNFFAHTADCALKIFQSHGYQLLIALYDHRDPGAALKMLMEHGVDGIYAFAQPEFPIQAEQSGLPLLLNHQHHEKFSDVCIGAEAPLAEAFQALGAPRVTGLFVPPSTWIGAFERACCVAGCTGKINLLPVAPDKRREAMKMICRSRPEAIFSNGWETISSLLELLDDEFPGYLPKILLHANCTGPFLADPRIFGVISSSTTELITRSCEMLMQQIEKSASKPSSLLLPARFLAASSAKYTSLITRHFALS